MLPNGISLREMAVSAFHHHDCSIDENSDCQRQTTEGHDVGLHRMTIHSGRCRELRHRATARTEFLVRDNNIIVDQQMSELRTSALHLTLELTWKQQKSS